MNFYFLESPLDDSQQFTALLLLRINTEYSKSVEGTLLVSKKYPNIGEYVMILSLAPGGGKKRDPGNEVASF